MKDQEKAKAELLRELETLRGKVAGFEKTEVEHKRAEEALRKSQESAFERFFSTLTMRYLSSIQSVT